MHPLESIIDLFDFKQDAQILDKTTNKVLTDGLRRRGFKVVQQDASVIFWDLGKNLETVLEAKQSGLPQHRLIVAFNQQTFLPSTADVVFKRQQILKKLKSLGYKVQHTYGLWPNLQQVDRVLPFGVVDKTYAYYAKSFWPRFLERFFVRILKRFTFAPVILIEARHD